MPSNLVYLKSALYFSLKPQSEFFVNDNDLWASLNWIEFILSSTYALEIWFNSWFDWSFSALRNLKDLTPDTFTDGALVAVEFVTKNIRWIFKANLVKISLRKFLNFLLLM